MTERSTGREVLTIGATLLGFYAISFLSFTKLQRQAILDRDGHKCQAKGIVPHQCSEADTAALQVHHLKPQLYLKKFGVDPDFAENGLTMCAEVHQNKIHPDMKNARRGYHKGDRQAFEHLQGKRQGKLDGHEIYWDDTWDRPLEVRALKNTQDAVKGGWLFPEKT